MKVLFTIYHGLGYGGAEVSTKVLAEGLQKLGHEIIFASSEKFENFDTRIFKEFDKIPSFEYHKKYLSKFLSDIIKDEKINIVHAQDRLTIPGAIVAAKRSKVPVVVHFRDHWYACLRSTCLTPSLEMHDVCSFDKIVKCFPIKKLPWNIYKLYFLKKTWKLLEKADLKIVPSNIVKEKLKLCGVKSNVEVISHARDIRDFSDVKVGNFKKEHRLGKVVITFVGSLTYIRGINILKSVFDLLNKEVSFVIAGDGPLLEELRKEAAAKHVQDYVRFLGRVPYSTIPRIYKASDIVIFPSLIEEPFSGVIVEAMASKRAVIASDLGGSRETIVENKTGFLIDPYNLDEWKNKLNLLIKNDRLRAKFGIKGYRLMKSRFNVDVISRKVEGEYKRVGS